MKPSFKYALILIVLLLSNSCATIKSNSSYYNYPLLDSLYLLVPGEISVSIDSLKDELIENQIFEISKTYLQALQNTPLGEFEEIYFNVHINQRAFMQNAEIYNGIYVSCQVNNSSGITYAAENEYICTKGSIVNTIEQNKIILRIISKIIKQQNKKIACFYNSQKDKIKKQAL